MPKINGAEAIAYFRSNYPRVPLIVLTGFPDTDMAASFLRKVWWIISLSRSRERN